MCPCVSVAVRDNSGELALSYQVHSGIKLKGVRCHYLLSHLTALSYFLIQGFSLNFHLVVLAKLAMQRALGINLSPSPSAWSLQACTTTAGFYMGSGALMLLRASTLPTELFSPSVQVQDVFTRQCILVHLCIK